MMHHTNQLELEASIGSSYKACFQGVNLRRTEIACLVWLIQTISGSPLMGSATYFFVSAGLPATTVRPVLGVLGKTLTIRLLPST